MTNQEFLDTVTSGATRIMPQIVESILSGTVTPTVLEDGLQVTVPFPEDEVIDPNGVTMYSEALASPEMLALFGLDASQGSRYVLVKMYSIPEPDADKKSLPSGQFPLPECYRWEPYDNSGIKLQAWVLGSPSAPWEAAMSSGAQCFITDPDTGLQVDAPLNCTLQPGTWSGTGGIGKPRKEWAGISSIPPQLL